MAVPGGQSLPLPPVLCQDTVLTLHVGVFLKACPQPVHDTAAIHLELTSFLNNSNWRYILNKFISECLAVIACVEDATLAEWSTIEYFLQRGRRAHLIVATPYEKRDSAVVQGFVRRFLKSNSTSLITRDGTWQNFPYCSWQKQNQTELPKWPQLETCVVPIVYRNYDGGFHPPLVGAKDHDDKHISPCNQEVFAVNEISNLTIVNVCSEDPDRVPVGRCSEDYRQLPSGQFGQLLNGEIDIFYCQWSYLEVRSR